MGSKVVPKTLLMRRLKEKIENKFPKAGAEMEKHGYLGSKGASKYAQMWTRESLNLAYYSKFLELCEITEDQFLSDGASQSEQTMCAEMDATRTKLDNLINAVCRHAKVMETLFVRLSDDKLMPAERMQAVDAAAASVEQLTAHALRVIGVPSRPPVPPSKQ